MVKKKSKKKVVKKISLKNVPSLQLKNEHEIAMDFAVKVSKKFNEMVKSIILFGSSVKKDQVAGSDIDVILILDDATIKWDQELIAWYRQELAELIEQNPYQKNLHINTVKLSTWWEDLLRGDPLIINILRYGEALIDFGGFFNPLKQLLIAGKIKSTPEAIYSCLQRAPVHIARSKASELGSIEGLYWAMVDSSHAALISANVSPPSPEHIPLELRQTFVDTKKLNIKYVQWFRDLLILHKKISHGEIKNLRGVDIDSWQDKTEEFLEVMAKLVNEMISK